MKNHLVELVGEDADFVVAVNVDGLLEIAGFAELFSDLDDVIERAGVSARGVKGKKNAGENREQGTDGG